MMFTEITLDNYAPLIDIENACHSHPWSIKTFESCIGGTYFGNFLSNKQHIVGFYIAQAIADEATLLDICVHPSFQGKGYGNQLLEHFINLSEQKKATTLFLEVRASNIPAQMLYMNHNFVEFNRRTGYYPSNKGFGYEDAIIMRRQ